MTGKEAPTVDSLAASALILAFVTYVAGAVGAALLADRPVAARVTGYTCATVAGLAGVVCSLAVLAGGSFPPIEIFRAAPYLPILVGVDSLSAWFVLIVSAVGAATSIAGLGYARHYDHHGGARLAAFFNLFLAAMLAVVVVQSLFAFFVVWEAMSLVSFALVVHDHERRDVRQAGLVYLVMTHVGTAFLFAGLLILAGAGGGFDYAALRAGAHALDPTTRSLVFAGALIGFGTKAGLIPLHVWLPLAHPIAPSHVSALMSGVMLKIAIYGFVRVVFDFLGGGPEWWGWLVLIVGIVSAVLGVLYAIMESDLKRLLAYHSVENLGIIVVGLGAALLLQSWHQPALAALGLAAGLFHSLNHALFKALLFLAAGAVDGATGTKNLERLGGLSRRMPQTAVMTLIGAAAISALPPLNGFASEWLTFQALLGVGTRAPAAGYALGAAILAGLLGLTGALAAACFVKAYGVAFLGIPRSAEAAKATEAPLALRLGMLPLAAGCVVLGFVPGLATQQLGAVTSVLLGAATPAAPLGAILIPSGASLVPLGTVGALMLLGALPVLALRAFGSVPTRRGPTWVCGWDLQPRMQYGSASFGKPIRLFFRAILRPERSVERTYAQKPYFLSAIGYHASLEPVFERYLYGPIQRAFLQIAHWSRVLQSGNLRQYLAYVLITLIVLLIAAR
jgi:hydrogenase-4 component B